MGAATTQAYNPPFHGVKFWKSFQEKLRRYLFPYLVQKQEEKHKNVTNKLCFHDICLLPINHISINNVKNNNNNMTHCCWESAALSWRRRLLTIVWVARDVCDFIMVAYQVLNGPRLIYYFSNMTSRLSSNISVFGLVLIVLTSLLGTARQCIREKFAILSLKPRSHVTILIHRTWAILRNWVALHKIKYFIAFWILSRNSKRKRKEKKAEITGVGWRYAPCRRTFLFRKTHQLLSRWIKRHDETVV